MMTPEEKIIAEMTKEEREELLRLLEDWRRESEAMLADLARYV